MPKKTLTRKKKVSKPVKKVSAKKKQVIDYTTEYTNLKIINETENYEKASVYLTNLEKKIKNNKGDKKENKFIINVLKLVTLSHFNKVVASLDLLKDLEAILEEFPNQILMQIDINLAKADCYWKIGKHTEALDILTNLEKIFGNLKLNNSVLERIGDLFNIKGIIFWLLGNISNSQNSFQSSLNIMGRVGNKVKFTDELNNLGNVLLYKGELNEALDLHLQALETRMQLGLKNQIASSLGNIAEIFHYKGEYEKSLENYRQSKEIFEEIQNVLFLAKLDYQLISLHLEYHNIEKAKEVLDELEILGKLNPTNEYIQMLFLFSQGLYFKKGERLLDKFHGAINFNKIVNYGKIIDNDIVVQSILNLTDILLLEIRLSKNEEILDDIQQYCEKVKKIAHGQNSAVVLVQGYFLESKLKLLNFEFTEAKNILNQAVSLSKEKSIFRFEYFATKELDKLLQTEDRWKELRERRAPLSERLDLTGIEETLTSLTRKRDENIEIEREQPVLFIVMQNGGLTSFSTKFKEDIEMDDNLIGGFISAVNTFGRQVFSNSGQIERIKHGDYTLISKTVLDKFTFCYGFKGSSYLASKKFDKLIETFLNHSITSVFLKNVKTGYVLEDKDDKTMKELVNACIFPNPETERQLFSAIST